MELFPRSRMRPVIALELLSFIQENDKLERYDPDDWTINAIAERHHCTTANVYSVIGKLLKAGLLKYEVKFYSLGDLKLIMQFVNEWRVFIEGSSNIPVEVKYLLEWVDAMEKNQEVEE